MSLVFTHNQPNPDGDAQLIYGITTTGGDFILYSDGTPDYEVEWGDGTVERSTDTEPVHTYAAGSYVLQIRTSQAYTPFFEDSDEEDLITSIKLQSDLDMGTDITSAFEGAENCTSIEAAFNATTGVEIFSFAFSIMGITSFPLIDTSSGTDFDYAFSENESLTTFPLIDTSSATTFFNAWYFCTALTSFPLLDSSNVTDFDQAWQDCSSLTSFPLIDTSSGLTFFETWQNCTSLTSFPLIDTSSATSLDSAWELDAGLTSFPLLTTSNVTLFNRAWRQCTSLTSFPLIDTSSGTDFNRAWSGCSGLTSFPLIDTSSGGDFTFAWYNNSSLTSFPQIDTSSGIDFQQCWRGCSSLVTFAAGVFDNWAGTPNTSTFQNCWEGCTSLSATSVENILDSIDTSGQSAPLSGVDITIDYDAGTGTPSITTAVTNLKSRGWTITLNGVLQ
jgi:hypothetical protein